MPANNHGHVHRRSLHDRDNAAWLRSFLRYEHYLLINLQEPYAFTTSLTSIFFACCENCNVSRYPCQGISTECPKCDTIREPTHRLRKHIEAAYERTN